jgi:hypothetical protein
MGVFGLAMAQPKTMIALVSFAGLMGSWSIFDALDGQTPQGTPFTDYVRIFALKCEDVRQEGFNALVHRCPQDAGPERGKL